MDRAGDKAKEKTALANARIPNQQDLERAIITVFTSTQGRRTHVDHSPNTHTHPTKSFQWCGSM